MFILAAFLPLQILLGRVPQQFGVELSDRPSAYVDLGPWSRRFQKIDSNGPCNVDASGWPTEDGISVLMDDRAVPAWAPPVDDPAHTQPQEAGKYTLQFSGKAVVSATGGSPVIVGASSYSASANTTTCAVELPPGQPDLIVLKFMQTRRTPSGTLHSGITSLHFFRPGYGPTTASQIFTSDFLKAIKPFHYLRFMGWLDTNYQAGYYGDTAHHILRWDSRNLPGQEIDRPGDQPHGLPWEYVVLLANRSHKDVWINIPVGASGEATSDTNSYIAQLAKLLKYGDAFTGNKGVNPELHIYIEHSNEVWNFGFSQYIWNKLAAIDAVKQGGSILNKDGSTDQEQWARRRHAVRLYQIAKIFEHVFGPNSLNRQIRPIYAGWTIQPDWYREVLLWMRSNFGPPESYFYGLAETAYFNDQRAAKNASPTQVLAAMVADSDNDRTNTSKLKAIASQFGLKLCAYEAGPDNGGGDPANIGNRILANRLPEMENAVVHNFRDNFYDLGGDMASYFALSSAFSRYGCWGATDDLSNLNTPKYEACLKLAGSISKVKVEGEEVQATPAPSHLEVHSAGDRQVLISWSPVHEGASYAVWYSTGGNFLIAGQGLTGTSFVHRNLSPNTTYVYYVTASYHGQTSPPSMQAGLAVGD